MELIFTHHAVEQIEKREIAFFEILACMASPTKIYHKDGKVNYLKLIRNDEYILLLPCRIKNDKCTIITVIITSQLKRYLKYG